MNTHTVTEGCFGPACHTAVHHVVTTVAATGHVSFTLVAVVAVATVAIALSVIRHFR